MGSRIVLTQSAPCNGLMPEVFSYKDKKNNWPLPFQMFQRKRMFYGPKEAIWNECEMLIRVVLRRIRNVNSFKKNENLKGYEMLSNVQRKFQWKFKENVFKCVECDFK